MAPGGGAGLKIPVTAGDAEVLTAVTTANATAAAAVPLEEPINAATYVCGPGDIFEVNFWGQQNFRLRISADVEGRVFISKVGFIDVAGKSLADVRALAKKKIRQSYPGLQVDLALTGPRTFRVHIVNFVKQPGTYEVQAVERLSSLLNRAGGVTGSRRGISIRHRDGTAVVADLVAYELMGDRTANPFLLDGDVIYVPAPGVLANIMGAVRRPGSYELVHGKDLNELVQLAGGFTSELTKTLPIRITRRGESQRARFIDVPAKDGAPSNQQVLDGDVVSVPTVVELQPSVLLMGAVTTADVVDAATAIKRLPYVEGDTVRSLIERAGGLRTTGDLARSYISRKGPDSVPTLIALDLEALLVRRDFSADKAVSLNDVIVVPPMQFGVLVEGAVMKAGLLEYNPRFGVQQYIARAGGRTSRAQDMEDVRLIDPNGDVRTYRNGIKVGPGDSILVPERNFSRAEIVQLSVAIAGLVLSGVAITLAATR